MFYRLRLVLVYCWVLAYASDIQLGIAVGGINMVGLGIVMVKLSDMTLTKE
jgi:hypothetical protein